MITTDREGELVVIIIPTMLKEFLQYIN